jgi:hypothetical protein
MTCFENGGSIKAVNFSVIWVTITANKAPVSREISVSRVGYLRDISLVKEGSIRKVLDSQGFWSNENAVCIYHCFVAGSNLMHEAIIK